MYWVEVETGKDYIMLMGGDVRGNWGIYFLHIMACYLLTMKSCIKVCEDYNKSFNWVLPWLQSIKEIIVALTIYKILQYCVGKVEDFKISDAVV